MTKLPTVCVPTSGKPLKLYLATNSEEVGALIAQEDQKGVDQPIYHVSRGLKLDIQGLKRLVSLSYMLHNDCDITFWLIYLMTKSHPIRFTLATPRSFQKASTMALAVVRIRDHPYHPYNCKREGYS